MTTRSFIRQVTQIRPSDLYDDTLTMANAEITAADIEDDLNFVRTQLKVLNGQPNWFDPALDSFNLTAIHNKLFTYWTQKMDDVTVGAGNNFVLLTGATKPAGNIAIASTALGTITAQLAGVIGANDLTVLANNANVMEIRDAATNLPIYTAEISGVEKQIFGLLQVGAAATDGNPFGDTSSGDQAQLSFVYLDPATDAWVAAPISAIENKVIEYAYRVRTDFYHLPENAFDQQITFVDNFAIQIVDLQDAYDNGNGVINLSSAKPLKFDLNGNADFQVVNGADNVMSTVKASSLINVGYNLALENQSELRLMEATTNGSTYTGFKAPATLAASVIYTMPIADGTANYALITDGAGNLSWGNVDMNSAKMVMVKTSVGNINANTAIDITDAVNFTIINPATLTMGAIAADWSKNYDVYLNGQLLVSDTAGSYDVFWASATTIKFTMKIHKDDIISIIRRRIG